MRSLSYSLLHSSLLVFSAATENVILENNVAEVTNVSEHCGLLRAVSKWATFNYELNQVFPCW